MPPIEASDRGAESYSSQKGGPPFGRAPLTNTLAREYRDLTRDATARGQCSKYGQLRNAPLGDAQYAWLLLLSSRFSTRARRDAKPAELRQDGQPVSNPSA